MQKLADAGVSAADIEAVVMPPDMAGLPDSERVKREAELGEARLRAEIAVLARAKATGKGRASRKASTMVLLASCRAHLGWDRTVAPESEPPDLEGAKARLLALYMRQRANLKADGEVEAADGRMVEGPAA